MRWAVLVSAAWWSCAPSQTSGDSPGTRSLRQAFPNPATLPQVGPPGSLLGSSLAKCPGAGFAAGAPGTGTGWHSPSGVTPPGVGEGLGRAVACVMTGMGTTEMIAGGDAGVRKALLGSWSPAAGLGSVLSLSSSDNPQLPLLLGYNAAVALANPTNGDQVGSTLTGTNGYGAVVRWYPSQARFAVTHAVGSMVRLYDFDAANSGVIAVDTITNAVPGFGRSIAVGNVLPSPGDELIIGATGAVYVYLNDGTGPVMRLTGNHSSFGASLATAPGNGGLHQLFVGEPGSDYVYRFLGDAGAVLTESANTAERFGASLAVNLSELAIGAPDHSSGAGAVYTVLLTPPLSMGEVQECTVGRTCFSQQCMSGECVGGVFCDLSAPFFECQPDETCSDGRCLSADGGAAVRDSGVIGPIDDGGVIIIDDGGVVFPIDGGVVIPPDASVQLDAGVSFDAGSADAGAVDPADSGVPPRPDGGVDAGAELDAGVKPPKDAGSELDGGVDGGVEPMIFTTSGCSQSAVLPMLALCLAMLRRRAR